MRKLVTTILVLVSSGMWSMAAAAAPRPADQPRTMEEVIDRVTANENHLNQEVRKYAPLVETYIQNLKPDKDLGSVPAGDKYFLGRADFSKGVNLVSLTEADTKSKKIFKSIGEDVLCYPKTAFDLRETTLSVDEFADDQQSPPLAHHFQRACNRTILTRIVFLQH